MAGNKHEKTLMFVIFHDRVFGTVLTLSQVLELHSSVFTQAEQISQSFLNLGCWFIMWDNDY